MKADPDASPQPSLPHPRDLWQQLPRRLQPDRYGYERNPAFWFTLNFPYNYVYEVHRFADAIHSANAFSRETFVPDVAVTTPLPSTPPTEE